MPRRRSRFYLSGNRAGRCIPTWLQADVDHNHTHMNMKIYKKDSEVFIPRARSWTVNAPSHSTVVAGPAASGDV